MNKRKVLFGALMLCLAGLATSSILWLRTHTAPRSVLAGLTMAQVSPLKVEIKLTQTAVKNDETFSVYTALRNSGSEVRVLEVWSCGYNDLWIADNPSVRVIGDVGCMKSFSTKKYLKPGEAFESTVPVRVELTHDKGQPESVTFRLGFKDPTFLANPKIPPIWSNAVTVSVTR